MDLTKLVASYHKAKRANWYNGVSVLAKSHNVLAKQHRQWSQAQTAKILEISTSLMSISYTLFNGFEKYPELMECATTDDARKRLTRLETGKQKSHSDYEKELQGKLIKYWDNFDLLKDWSLVEQYYKIDDKNIIDVLAKHKSEPKWLVIELKRNRASDYTVGQLLRYMGRLKEQKDCNDIYGAIVAHDPDDDTYYAIQFVSNISLWVYNETTPSLLLKEYDKSIKPSDVINERELSRLMNLLTAEQLSTLFKQEKLKNR